MLPNLNPAKFTFLLSEIPLFTNILTWIRGARERLPLSPAETSVAGFVLCALLASLVFRAWSAWSAPAVRPVPAEFAALDSVFAARSRTPVVPAVLSQEDGAFYAASHGARKTLPPPHSVELNSAGPDVLRRLPAVGPALAARIIAYRRVTPFRRAQDLLRVEGIGAKKFSRMQPFVYVQ